MSTKFVFVSILITLFIVFCAFISDNPYFIIKAQDVKLTIPKGFPKPVYTFKDNIPTPAGFILGRRLFYDPVLSKDSSTSCASCHQRFAAFSHIDHSLAHGINGLIGKRNVPPLQNLIWQTSFMWDGGINHLELQPLGPINNPNEMDETIKHLVLKLQRNKTYCKLFKNAFGDTLVTSQRTLKALSQFLGLMISSNSKYDKYVRHEIDFTEEEKRGEVLVHERCANCHPAPLFTNNSFRNIGLKPDTALKDSGRFKITGNPEDYMKFKVPTLRNVEMTYPYMHDGRFHTLRQVLNHYAAGKYYTNNFDMSLNKTKGLTEKEKDDIIAFLKTLTDKTFLYDLRFADPTEYQPK